MEEGTVVAWHKREGDKISYGDELCELVVEEVTRLQRRLSARLGAGRRSARVKYRTLEGVTVRFRILSSEVGVLRQIIAVPGTAVTMGDLLGVVDSTEDAPVSGSSGPASTARVVVDLVGPAPMGPTP
jgi:pyruvate/2-oxoglutarate dehydrogenase complex dihydrolipoamide acyltransferase (E2) component